MKTWSNSQTVQAHAKVQCQTEGRNVEAPCDEDNNKPEEVLDHHGVFHLVERQGLLLLVQVFSAEQLD